MRINELLTESQQQELAEGPILNKIGTGIGKVASGAAKAVGAVAGGVAGLGGAIKQGFQAGKQTVQGAVDQQPVAAPAGGQQAKQAPQGGSAPTTAAAINAQGPKGTAAAKTQTGAGAQALAKTAQATQNATADQAGQTVYAQVKANIDKLDKKGKQRILQLLQKSVAAPAVKPAAGGDAMGAMAKQLGAADAAEPNNTMANAPVSKTNKAKPGNPNAVPPADQAAAPAALPADQAAAPAAPPAAEPTTKRRGGRVAGQQSQTPSAIKRREQRAANKKPTQAEIDADRDRLMGNFADSVINNKLSLEETLAQKIKEQKRKIFENNLLSGQTSIFRK